MSTANPSERAGDTRVVDDIVCPYCACACDDIRLQIEDDRIVEAENACPVARTVFLGYRPRSSPPCLIDGEPAAVEDGIERAARILAESGYPLIFGLGETTTEAHRAAVSLGDRIGACLDFSGIDGDNSAIEALQRVGEVTCTLGEIRNRADLILVWRADPLQSHPRLLSRYALDPMGDFVPGGRSDRYCVIVDVRETWSVREVADQFLAIKEDGEVEALWALRALAKGIELDAEAVQSATGVPLEAWRDLLERMKAARYGVLFYGPAPLVSHAVHSLTRDLHEFTRFTCMPVTPFGPNLVGARNVLAWSTGYPAAVSLARGYPRHGPGEFGAVPLLGDGLVDSALAIGGEWFEELPARAQQHLARIPVIVLESYNEDPPHGMAVFFRTALFGINATGTVYRMDGVPLPLRTVLPSSYPSDVEILRAIDRRVRHLLETNPAGKGGE
jgi:formylmethanofuran dehydrogenase subunit B